MTAVAEPPRLDQLAWPRHTARLALRPAVPADAAATWRFRGREDVSRWLTRAPATEVEHRASFVDPDSLAVTLVVELEGAVVGDLMVRTEPVWAQAEAPAADRRFQAELGWVLHPSHAGRGYATEAVREVLRLAFGDLHLHRVTATCFAANTASSRLMERVGMRRELHAVRDALHRSGEWMDTVGYALLADEHAARDGDGRRDADVMARGRIGDRRP